MRKDLLIFFGVLIAFFVTVTLVGATINYISSIGSPFTNDSNQFYFPWGVGS